MKGPHISEDNCGSSLFKLARKQAPFEFFARLWGQSEPGQVSRMRFWGGQAEQFWSGNGASTQRRKGAETQRNGRGKALRPDAGEGVATG
jgi:hypothetical protein